MQDIPEQWQPQDNEDMQTIEDTRTSMNCFNNKRKLKIQELWQVSDV